MEYMKAIDKLLAPIKKLSMNALVANSSWLDSQVKKYNILYTKAANNYKSNIKKIENAAVLSYKRELAINEILKSGEYDFDNILVIKNLPKNRIPEQSNDKTMNCILPTFVNN